MKDAGIKVVGYIYTEYGKRPASTVEDRMALYMDLYDVDGVMFDEMARLPGEEEYYSRLGLHAKRLGMSLTVGNPGAPIAESYLPTLDVIEIYEGAGYPSFSDLGARTFHGRYGPEKFGAFIHSLTSYSALWVKRSARYVKHVYLTTGSLPNPYDPISPYLSELASDLSSA